VQASGLEQSLIELVKTRASQINGCAFCIKYAHRGCAQARRNRTAALSTETPGARPPVSIPDRERAALAWTEAVTLISETHAPDDVYDEVRKHFSGNRDRQPHHADRDHQRLETGSRSRSARCRRWKAKASTAA